MSGFNILTYMVVMTTISLCLSENFGEEFNSWEDTVISPYYHVVGRAGENCQEACWSQGYPTCVSNPGTTEEVVGMLYYLVQYGQISLYEASWTEDYHPVIESDDNFVGWDAIPETGGSCGAYSPDPTQRRLCRCSIDGCEDTFTFCSILRFICSKYSYTRNSCHATCVTCEDLNEISDIEQFGTYAGEDAGGDFFEGEFGEGDAIGGFTP